MRLDYRLFKAGSCRHLEYAAIRTGGLKPCQFPALAAAIFHPTRGTILFDTGYSEHLFDATARFPHRIYRWVTPVDYQPSDRLASQLSMLGVSPGDVGTIFLSHFHGDHIAGVSDFPAADIICSEPSYREAKGRTGLPALLGACPPHLVRIIGERQITFVEHCSTVSLPGELAPFDVGLDLLGDGSLIAIALPGHATTQFGLAFRDLDGRWCFFVADAAWFTRSIRDNTPPPHLVMSLLGHARAYKKTLYDLHRLSQNNPDARLIPSHCMEAASACTGGPTCASS